MAVPAVPARPAVRRNWNGRRRSCGNGPMEIINRIENTLRIVPRCFPSDRRPCFVFVCCLFEFRLLFFPFSFPFFSLVHALPSLANSTFHCFQRNCNSRSSLFIFVRVSFVSIVDVSFDYVVPMRR